MATAHTFDCNASGLHKNVIHVKFISDFLNLQHSLNFLYPPQTLRSKNQQLAALNRCFLCLFVCVHSCLWCDECGGCLNMSALFGKYMCHLWVCLTRRESEAGRRAEWQRLLTQSFSRLQRGSNAPLVRPLTHLHTKLLYAVCLFFSCSGGSAAQPQAEV